MGGYQSRLNKPLNEGTAGEMSPSFLDAHVRSRTPSLIHTFRSAWALLPPAKWESDGKDKRISLSLYNHEHH